MYSWRYWESVCGGWLNHVRWRIFVQRPTWVRRLFPYRSRYSWFSSAELVDRCVPISDTSRAHHLKSTSAPDRLHLDHNGGNRDTTHRTYIRPGSSFLSGRTPHSSAVTPTSPSPLFTSLRLPYSRRPLPSDPSHDPPLLSSRPVSVALRLRVQARGLSVPRE